MNKKFIIVLFASLLGFSGCDAVSGMLGLSTPDQPAPQPQKKAKKKVKKKVAAKPVKSKAKTSDYTRPEYPNNTRRNPFQPYPEIILPIAKSLSEERPKQPMEQFSLSELELVAIISSVAVPKAMFIDPTGFGHVLKEGERIGRNGGVVSDIRDNEVDIREGGDDNGQSRVVTLRLREVEIHSGDDDDLSEEEKDALKKLLRSEEGRKALQRSFEDSALGASSVEKNNNNNNNAVGVNSPVDNRFKGVRPPSSN